MRKRFLILVCLSLMGCCAGLAEEPAAALFGEILTRGTTYSNLVALNDTVGARPATSPAYSRAVDFALARFREYGYADARVESFKLAAGWLRGPAAAEVLAPVSRGLGVVSMPWSQPTPADGLEAALIDLGSGGEAAFGRAGALARGRIGLVTLRGLEDARLEELLAENNSYPVIYRRAVRAGLAALLFASPHAGNQFFAIPVRGRAQLTEIPVANILRQDALALSRLAAGGTPARLRLRLENETAPAVGQNVVAELRGRENPEEVVLVGAHYDSWDMGTGALDNGVNSMSLLEVARAIRALNLRPRTTLRFVLFGAEELGMLGSREFAAAHRDELDRIRAVLIMDEGAGRVLGFSLGGRAEMEAPLREAFAPLAALGILNFTADAFFGTDNFWFLTEGVPNVVVTQDLREYVRHYHSNTDSIERIDRREALLNSAIFAIAAFQLADAPARPAGRQGREEVLRLIRETGVDAALEAWGEWPLP